MKRIALAVAVVMLMVGLTACGKLDVIGDHSVKSFEAILSAMDDQVSTEEEFGGWSLTAPDGTASFEWSKDFRETTGYDVRLVADAQPFLDAGLDPAKLPEGMFVNNRIIVGVTLGEDEFTDVGAATPIDSYQKIVDHARDTISYHAALDHFGIKMDNGNMFEWAKDMKTNDKDIVFVLNPQPFIDAGVDPEKVADWVFAKVETMDESGKNIEVDKFLKPFDVER